MFLKQTLAQKEHLCLCTCTLDNFFNDKVQIQHPRIASIDVELHLARTHNVIPEDGCFICPKAQKYFHYGWRREVLGDYSFPQFFLYWLSCQVWVSDFIPGLAITCELSLLGLTLLIQEISLVFYQINPEVNDSGYSPAAAWTIRQPVLQQGSK